MKKLPDDLLFAIALTMVPHIGIIQSRILYEHFPGAAEIFRASMAELEKIPGMGKVRARSIRSFREFRAAEKEISFIEKFNITPLLIRDPDYPKRLRHCEDPPAILYYKGNADLNASKVLSIVGTRRHTEYGKTAVADFIAELAGTDILIISGLAYGVDAIAHRQSLKYGLKTVGVLAHGLDRIYPTLHQGLAREMLQQGGLITDFPSGTQPDKQNFPKRNRIVAGMADALMVVETEISGGSMITVDIAEGYHREVFALPGRINDLMSAGCNFLIRENRAYLAASSRDILDIMNWGETEKKPQKQPVLFYEPEGNEKLIIDQLKEKGAMHIDALQTSSGLSQTFFSSTVLSLEMAGVIRVMPGKIYTLANAGE